MSLSISYGSGFLSNRALISVLRLLRSHTRLAIRSNWGGLSTSKSRRYGRIDERNCGEEPLMTVSKTFRAGFVVSFALRSILSNVAGVGSERRVISRRLSLTRKYRGQVIIGEHAVSGRPESQTPLSVRLWGDPWETHWPIVQAVLTIIAMSTAPHTKVV